MRILEIYCPKLSSRVVYAFEFLFQQLEGIEYRLFENTEFSDNYFFRLDDKAVSLPACIDWTFQSIHELKMNTTHVEGGLKAAQDEEYCINYDLPAAIFFMLSRVEEYDLQSDDRYGRFSAQHSILFEHDLLENPVVDFWVKAFERFLQSSFPEIPICIKEPDPFFLTADIDNAFAIKYRHWTKNAISFIASLAKGDLEGFLEKIRIVLNLKPDPFDTYDELIELSKVSSLPLHLFFLLGDSKGQDYNIGYKNPAMKKLINRLNSKDAVIGIHPSIASDNSVAKVNQEKNRLVTLLSHPVDNSRQHYLKFHFPETCYTLIKCGIKNDFSLGFHDALGFRAGTGRGFYFYDFIKEEKTTLKLIPFAAMDTTLLRYMNLRPVTALEKLRICYSNTRKQGSTFTLLMHNESLSEYGPWKEWSNVFKQFVKEIGHQPKI